jgi:hypothetical protein
LAFLLLAVLPTLLNAQTDDFNDGNDAGWTRYNPIGVGTFSVENGAYRLRTTPSGTAVNPGRAGALRPDATYTDFYISVDIVHWDTNVNQAFGILARLSEVGLGRTKGYAMTWDRNGRDLDISSISNEAPSGVSVAGTDVANITAGKTYRMAFSGKGSQLTGEIYELPNLDTPMASITGNNALWASGTAGLIVYDNSSAGNGSTDTTFDNYFALAFKPPRLKIEALPFQDMRISWPAEPANYVLQATSTLGLGWTDITDNIEESDGQRSYVDSSFDRDYRFYRLRP